MTSPYDRMQDEIDNKIAFVRRDIGVIVGEANRMNLLAIYLMKQNGGTVNLKDTDLEELKDYEILVVDTDPNTHDVKLAVVKKN